MDEGINSLFKNLGEIVTNELLKFLRNKNDGYYFILKDL